jgi:hypothetical protein
LYRLVDEPEHALRHNLRIVWICDVEVTGAVFPDYYIRALLEVAEQHMACPTGDLAVAKEHLEKVAKTNADEHVKLAASEMLKAIKHKIGRTRGS